MLIEKVSWSFSDLPEEGDVGFVIRTWASVLGPTHSPFQLHPSWRPWTTYPPPWTSPAEAALASHLPPSTTSPVRQRWCRIHMGWALWLTWHSLVPILLTSIVILISRPTLLHLPPPPGMVLLLQIQDLLVSINYN